MPWNKLYVIISPLFALTVHGNFPHNCKFNVELNITDGQRRGGDIIKYGITFPRYFIKDDTIIGCPCEVSVCLKKCCAMGKSLYLSGCYELSENLPQINVSHMKEDLEPRKVFYHNSRLPCMKSSNYTLRLYTDDNFSIMEDGSIHYYYFKNEFKIANSNMYCVDNYRNKENSTRLAALVCIEKPNDEDFNNFLYGSYGMLIAMPFLLAAFMVYAFLPDRKFPAKALMCYISSLLFAYILLVTIQLDNSYGNTTCRALAIFCYFFFMASFFWMNASCLDIFFTFSGIRGLLCERQRENRRSMYYGIYAWGFPVLMVDFVTLFGENQSTESVFYTGLGDGQCWFRHGWATGIYFYLPIATLLIINIVLFGITTYNIKKVQRDTIMLEYDSNDKQRFNLYVKLLSAMGIYWSMEVISWVILWKWTTVPDSVWILTNVCNAVYGVFIFYILVFKRSIWMRLKKRYLEVTGRPQQALALTSMHRTRVNRL